MMKSAISLIWITFIHLVSIPPNQGYENVILSSNSSTLNSTTFHDETRQNQSSTITGSNQTNPQKEIETIRAESSFLSSKLMSFANHPMMSPLEARRNSSLGEAIRSLMAPKDQIQPRINPLAPLLALLRILLLPLRILLAPLIILLRAIIQILRLLLRLLNPVFLLFAFLAAANMAANIARIVELILRLILRLLRREREEKDESRETKIITIVEDDTTTERPQIYFKPPKTPHKKIHKKIKPRISERKNFEQQTIDDIMEKERLIIRKLICLGALTSYPPDLQSKPQAHLLVWDPYIRMQCDGNVPNLYHLTYKI